MTRILKLVKLVMLKEKTIISFIKVFSLVDLSFDKVIDFLFNTYIKYVRWNTWKLELPRAIRNAQKNRVFIENIRQTGFLLVKEDQQILARNLQLKRATNAFSIFVEDLALKMTPEQRKIAYDALSDIYPEWGLKKLRIESTIYKIEQDRNAAKKNTHT